MEPFIGQIIIFAGNFAPRGWAMCHGQLLSISENTALFSILGTTYGGNGKTTFGLPDLRGRVPISAGDGPGLSVHTLGQKSGAEQVTLSAANMPSHNHSLNVFSGDAKQSSASGNVLGDAQTQVYSSDSPNATASEHAIANTGGSQPVSTMQPYLAINYIIALQGLYPSRS
ncbi:phage tail protein [Pseudenhygromyxa sp. WMMC2535]|uniref:phage tail protein n=1 Tax=Pseudenhygromyxa sp. WMMC2535 TaxID=2712867 RepID=UPI001555FBD9|nr:tail fiber protein [Pseudenhygromyxa sp. WMMC2535]NVB39024.1 phage tail protein [Pseudenhygromyxa sp. WMMC2535]